MQRAAIVIATLAVGSTAAASHLPFPITASSSLTDTHIQFRLGYEQDPHSFIPDTTVPLPHGDLFELRLDGFFVGTDIVATSDPPFRFESDSTRHFYIVQNDPIIALSDGTFLGSFLRIGPNNYVPITVPYEIQGNELILNIGRDNLRWPIVDRPTGNTYTISQSFGAPGDLAYLLQVGQFYDLTTIPLLIPEPATHFLGLLGVSLLCAVHPWRKTPLYGRE